MSNGLSLRRLAEMIREGMKGWVKDSIFVLKRFHCAFMSNDELCDWNSGKNASSSRDSDE